jgi:hypothetical protein
LGINIIFLRSITIRFAFYSCLGLK